MFELYVVFGDYVGVFELCDVCDDGCVCYVELVCEIGDVGVCIGL